MTAHTAAMNGSARRLAALALGASACGDNLIYPFDDLIMVSGPSPFLEGCNSRPQTGANYRGSEVEPYIAINPKNPQHFIGVWQQDRWSNGGSSGLVTAYSTDGGASWARTLVPFSRCARATAGSVGDYERASDPWVTFASDGAAYQIALVLDNSGQVARSAILASRSTDGGSTWNDPDVLIADNDPDVFNDKESITADPVDPKRVYAVWDRLTGLTRPREPIGTGPTWFARTNGAVWEPSRIIFDPGIDAQTIGNQIVVLPDGTLINGFTLVHNASSSTTSYEVAIIRSEDQGTTWSPPVIVAPMRFTTVTDPENNVALRGGAIIAEIEVDPRSGVLYFAWEDSSLAMNGRNAIVLSRSTDGGRTWSPLQRVNGEPSAHAFTPALAVASDGTLGLSYYDLRAGATADFQTTNWLATSDDSGVTWTEEPLTCAFDLRSTRFGNVYFLGDYQGLAVSGTSFVPFFSAALAQGTPTAIFTRPLR